MKHIKQLLVFLLIISVFNSCEKEEVVSYALDDISAPTDIAALFDISAEEVGLVTITPSADGATMFEIYFGDEENETPMEVAPGETITHVYGEGEFNLRIVAIGLTGLTTELVRVVTISLEAPEDLEVDIKISGTNPYEVEVSASATNATVFDVYFGDTADEDRAEDGDPVTIMPEETATYEYSETGDYNVRVVARGAGAATLEYTEEISITGASNAMSLPLTFDDATVNYEFVAFNGTSFEVVDNPDVSGANDAGSNVGAITNSGAQYEGGTFELDPPVDFSGNNKTITMKFWSEVSLPVLLKFEGGVNDERQNEVAATHGGTGWEVLTFNFATDAVKSYIDGGQGVGESFVPTGQYAKLVLFIDGPGTTAGTFYIDDIEHVAGNGDGGGSVSGEISDDFDANRNIGTWYGDACGMNDSFPNPFKTGINTSNTVLEYKDDGGQYANVGFNVDPNFDLAVDNTFSLKIYVPSSSITGSQPNQISLKLQDGTVGEPWAQQTEIIKPIVLDQWQTVTFDFANDVTAGAADPLSRTDFNRVVLQVNGENNNDFVTAYIDDFNYGADNSPVETTTPVVGTWKLAAEEKALLVGSTAGDIWWFNSAEDVTTRACLFDDTYVFNSDGSFNNVLGANTWIEGWQGGSDACGAAVAPHDGSVAATYAYDAAAGTVTLNGVGAFLGIPKAYNGGELSDPANAPASVTYNVELSDNDNTMDLEILVGNGNVWYFKLVREGSNTDTGGSDGGADAGGSGSASGDVAENGGFETGNLDGWAVYKNGGIIEADNTQSNGGTWSAKIVASSPAGLNPTLKQERKGAGSVAVGDIVQIKFDYKGSAAAGGIYSIQSFVEAESGVNQTEVFSVTPTEAWQTFTTTYTVNAGDVSGGITMEFTAICGGDAACNSTLILDNVSVTLNP